ncbi:hypothetical protein CLV28_2191 [Sediminihabitans luteus]|uniref:FtsX-like permease family protein n=1 Tax=Sediminihabitans luteus TaxID=1138585 RepID=A0A2M9CEQ5_9CELL|nr:hypothetical protein [Sediminihabitans luteus]PJJ70357.1 hypothetical protein CLV28_2191 [Sediminihabitans luteus]GII97829.1 hypothetical protein Slu03_02070 [Sediminihabitans luteus]
MTRTLLALAARGATTRDLAHRWRQVSVLVGSLLATLAILAATAFVVAAHGAQTRADARTPVVTADGTGAPLRMVERGTVWDRRQFPVVWLEASDGAGDVPLPPGLAALPAPGTVAASPAMLDAGVLDGLDLVASPVGTGARGAIGDEGLRASSEMLAYAVPAPGRGLGKGGSVVGVTGFGPDAAGVGTLQGWETEPETAPVAWVVTFALLTLVLPGLVLLVGCASSASAYRGGRAATLRVLGLSPGQVRAVGGVETLLVAVPGVLLGVLAWIALAPGRSFPGGELVLLPGALVLPAGAVAVCAVAVAGVAGVVGALPARPAARTTGALTSALRARAGSGRAGLVLLGAGFAVMVASRSTAGELAYLVNGVGLIATAVGLPLAMPWFVRAVGAAVSRSDRPEAWLAGRRLVHSPVALARPGVAIALLVFLLGAATSVVRDAADVEGSGTVVANWRDPRPGDLAAVHDRLGVGSPGAGGFAVAMRSDRGATLHVATCDDAARLAGLPDCSVVVGGPEAALARAAERVGALDATVGDPPELTDAGAWDVVYTLGPGQRVEDVEAAFAGLPAANVGSDIALRPPAAMALVGPAILMAAGLLLAAALHAFGNRSIGQSADDGRLLTVAGMTVRQVRRMHRRTLLAPVVVTVPVATGAAVVEAWAMTSVELTQVVVAPLVVQGLVTIGATALVALGVARFQLRLLAAATR